jgi:hypothetical protein
MAGWRLGGAVQPVARDTAPAARIAGAGPVELVVPTEWSVRSRLPVEGLRPERTTVLAPTAGVPAYVVVTVEKVDHPSLVPAALRAVTLRPVPEPVRTTVLERPAWGYGELPIKGNRLMDVTVVPSTVGVLAIACIAPRQWWSAATGCAGGLRAMRLPDGAWLRPSPDVAFYARLPMVVRRLDRERSLGRAGLRRARTPEAQSVQARRLGLAYERAASALAPYAGPGEGATRVIAALRRSARAHRRLAGAAASGSPRRYARARQAIDGLDARLAGAFERG